MTKQQTNKEAFMELTRAVIFGAVMLGVALTFIFTLGLQGNDEWTKFKVVDTYKECDVVRYMPEGGAKYYYFLDCR